MIGIRFSGETGEGGAGVRECVDADSEPRHPVTAADADQAEQQDDDHLHRGEAAHHVTRRVRRLRQRPEVHGHDRADEEPENKKEAALGEQVRLARLVNQLGDLQHRRVDGHVLQRPERHQPEQQAESANEKTAQEERVPIDSEEVH